MSTGEESLGSGAGSQLCTFSNDSLLPKIDDQVFKHMILPGTFYIQINHTIPGPHKQTEIS